MKIYGSRKFDVEEVNAKLPNGKRRNISIVRSRNAVIILPVIGDSIVMIREYRPVIRRWIYSLPAGTMDRNSESPAACARRELEEEAGYRSGKMEFMFKSYPSPGIITELQYNFLATSLKKTRQKLESYEVIKAKKMKISRVKEMIKDNEIVDAHTRQAVLYYLTFWR